MPGENGTTAIGFPRVIFWDAVCVDGRTGSGMGGGSGIGGSNADAVVAS